MPELEQKRICRVTLGQKGSYARECVDGGFIGMDFGIAEDLATRLPERWESFNREFIPVYLQLHPNKTRIAAGLACGALWTVSKGIKTGDLVISPDGAGSYFAGEVVSDYQYRPGEILPHRRLVRWFATSIASAGMTDGLRRAAGSGGAFSDLTQYRDELLQLLSGVPPKPPGAMEEVAETLAEFGMEKHLEDFLVENWAQTELGRDFELYQDEDETVGQQYQTDTGPLDLLAQSKDKKTLLVVELKKGKASDAVVGQILRYMSYVQDELVTPGQTVRGVIIALKDDEKIRRAMRMVPALTFYRYEVSFKLVKTAPDIE